MIGNMEYHEVASVFPMMDGLAFKELKADIKDNGLKQAIVLYEGKVLDGRNRHKACVELGIKYKSEEYTGTDPVGHVISLNLHRRQLTTSQRAMVAAKIANLPAYRPPGSRSNDLLTQSKVAESLKVSVPSVKRAKNVLALGTKGEIKAAETGEETVASLEKKVLERVRKESPEKLPSAKRFTQTANYKKKLMEKGLTAIEGTCIGLVQLDWEMVNSACTEEERNRWGDLAAKLSTKLRKISKILKGGGEDVDKE